MFKRSRRFSLMAASLAIAAILPMSFTTAHAGIGPTLNDEAFEEAATSAGTEWAELSFTVNDEALPKIILANNDAEPAPVRDIINKADHALSNAMGAISLDTGSSGFGVGVGLGTFEGASAAALGVVYKVNHVMTVRGNVGVTDDADSGAGVSLNFAF